MADVAKPISWEAVRALAMVVGVREAARRMGISEEATMKRCQREGWLSTPEAKRAVALAVAERSGITVRPQMSAGALIQQEIQQLGSSTKLSLARGIAKAGKHVEAMEGVEIVKDAQNIKAIAQTANTIHNWSENSPQVKIRLDLLAAQNERPVIDVESSTVTDTESEHNELDDY